MNDLTSSPVIKRHPANPVLSARDVKAYPASLVFNAGVTKFDGRYVCVFRNDFGDEKTHKLAGTNLGLAFSDDGVRWQVTDRPCFELHGGGFYRATDPRLTVIDSRCYMCFAVDSKWGIRGGLAVTDDFERWQVLSMSAPDNRNMVLFPEKVRGKYVRLERPFPIYGKGKPESFDIWHADSPDLKYWGNNQPVLAADELSWCNNKIGPGAPPVKTPAGWLTTIHVVDKDPARHYPGWEGGTWNKRYCAGLMLLDLHEPWKVVGLMRRPLIVPEEPYSYEVRDGFRTHVIFPTGMILEDSGEVKIYYGSADAVMALATAHLADLVNLCEPV